LKRLGPELHIIGDSLEPRNSFFAIHEGFRVGNLISGPSDADFEEVKGIGESFDVTHHIMKGGGI
jgi:hypothetical protein